MNISKNMTSLCEKVRNENNAMLPLYHPTRLIKRFIGSILHAIGTFFIVILITDFPIEKLNVCPAVITSILFFVWLSESVILIDVVLEKLMPLDVMNFKNRSWIQFIISISMTSLIGYIMYLTADIPRDDIEFREILTFTIFGLWTLTMSHLMSLMHRALMKWLESETEIEELKLEKTELSRRALIDQLNPHFLFNNLSTLKSLIVLKQEKEATSFISNFASIYRYVLQRSDWVTVSVKEELKFINQYYALHKERLGDGLEAIFTIAEEHIDKQVPPMTLQLLLENAIKHNIADEDQVLEIEGYIENDYFVLKNNIQLKRSSYSTERGLNNLVERYRLLTEREVLIEKGSEFFVVRVPLITE